MEERSLVKVSKTIYILYLVGFIFPIFTIIGVIVAYIYESDATDYLKSHFRYQIRGFWIYLLYYCISIILVAAVIGLLLLPLTMIWWIIRNIKGFKSADKEQVIDAPKTWTF